MLTYRQSAGMHAAPDGDVVGTSQPTTRSLTRVAPTASRSDQAVWWVEARRDPTIPACASSIMPVQTPAMSDVDWRASPRSGRRSPRWTSPQAPASSRAAQPPPGTTRTSAAPGSKIPSGTKRSPYAPRTVSCACRVTRRVSMSDPRLPALRKTSAGPQASISSRPSKTRMSMSTSRGQGRFSAGEIRLPAARRIWPRAASRPRPSLRRCPRGQGACDRPRGSGSVDMR